LNRRRGANTWSAKEQDVLLAAEAA